MNAHAEELRTLFVAHEGQRELCVDFGNWDAMADEMSQLISVSVSDPELVSWIIPAFSTTTVTDRTVSCMIMMATLKHYFTYAGGIECGIPRVTLEGAKQDWQAVRDKIEKLKEFGVQCIAWYHLLVPVLDRFVSAFDNPDGAENIEHWRNVVELRHGSGVSYLGGWLTAFCVFTAEGRWLGFPLNNVRTTAESASRSSHLSNAY